MKKWVATCNFDTGKGEIPKGALVDHSEELEKLGLIAPVEGPEEMTNEDAQKAVDAGEASVPPEAIVGVPHEPKKHGKGKKK
jgi:hypothetical protein